MNDLETLREQVLSLPIGDLMEDILASFSQGERDAIDKAWGDEIERRRTAYRAGLIGTVSLEESQTRLGR